MSDEKELAGNQGGATAGLPLSVGYNKAFGGFMLVCSLFILGVAVLTGTLFPQALTGGILLLVSLGYLTQPALVITASEVQLKNMLGMTVKSYAVREPADLKLRDGKLMVRDEQLRTAKWLLSGADWARLEALVARGGSGGAAAPR